MTREELIRSKSYHLTRIQNELFRHVNEYIEKKGINRSKFAEELGVTKGYVTQILNGEFDFKLSKLIELAIAIGKIPEINYAEIEELLENKSKEQLEVSYLSGPDTDDLHWTLPGKIVQFNQDPKNPVFSSTCR